jgi:short-subunit dehydrogenase
MALVTGASSGIGAGYADRLARLGYDPILVARSAEKLHALSDRLFDETGACPEVFPADLNDPEDLFAVERRLATDDRIAVLVNNAGIAGTGTFAGAEPGSLETLIDLNVVAVSRLAAAAAGQMMRKRRGTIVNVSSVTALMPESFDPVYSASKAYVLALSQAMARELEPHGIRVQAVLPGITRTAIWEKSGHSLDDLPPDMVMDVGDLVDAALEGLTLGETVTIPSLPDAADWLAFEEMRHSLQPKLSLRSPAARYVAAGRKAA